MHVSGHTQEWTCLCVCMNRWICVCVFVCACACVCQRGTCTRGGQSVMSSNFCYCSPTYHLKQGLLMFCFIFRSSCFLKYNPQNRKHTEGWNSFLWNTKLLLGIIITLTFAPMVQKGNKPENPSTKKCHMLKRVTKCLNKKKLIFKFKKSIVPSLILFFFFNFFFL